MKKELKISILNEMKSILLDFESRSYKGSFNKHISMCTAFRIANEPQSNKTLFLSIPEIIQFQPAHKPEQWFELNEYGTSKRIDVINKTIEVVLQSKETEKEECVVYFTSKEP